MKNTIVPDRINLSALYNSEAKLKQGMEG